jgi:hypothetical protein
MFKSYLKFILITLLISPAAYFQFEVAGVNGIEACVLMYIPLWVIGILVFNFIENGHGFDFKDKTKVTNEKVSNILNK